MKSILSVFMALLYILGDVLMEVFTTLINMSFLLGWFAGMLCLRTRGYNVAFVIYVLLILVWFICFVIRHVKRTQET